MRMFGPTALCATVIFLSAVEIAISQDQLTHTDQMVVAMLKEKPKSGVLILEATLLMQGKQLRCNGFNVYLKSTEGKTIITNSGRISVAPEGDYTVLRAVCGPWVGMSGEAYEGPFAKIRLGAGEVVNAGKLVVDYKLENGWTGKKSYRISAQGLSPAQIAQLKEKAPRTFSKAIKRTVTALKVATN
ncbi:hypothetical protein YH63_004975 [Afipia massiliensis]|uniref:Uncharacterized protein n=1 Tax=Afipia massiliensis TaxID=211460 RepID=A0A4U6BKP9_9BRAD|nr:hypothetical protein [Afipia massiliensis]TKT70816.1 hypothetical protein YH63_004975 [Afipia massiliensis]